MCKFVECFIKMGTCYLVIIALFSKIITCQQNVKLTNRSPIPSSVSTSNISLARRQLSIFSIINYSGGMPLGSPCTESMRVALAAVEKTPNLLSDYKLSIELLDDQTVNYQSTSMLTNWLRGTYTDNKTFLPIILGTALLHVGQFVQLYNFILISHYHVLHSSKALGYERDRYPTAFPLLMIHEFVYPAFVACMEAMNWKKVAIISTGNYYWNRWDYSLMDQMIKRNITMLGYLKIPILLGLNQPLPNDIESTVVDLANIKEARIIVVHVGAAVDVSCYLYKYNLYGPDYVLLYPQFSYFTNDTPKPYSWCTSEMLAKVLETAIFFGQVPEAEIQSQAVNSSLGVNVELLNRELQSKIENPETFQKWSLRSTCFDLIMVASYLLNATEAKLKQRRNETLLDWTVNGNSFRANGSVILDLMNETMYEVELDGLVSKYKFNKETGFNWNGNFKLALTQPQVNAKYENGSAKTIVPVYPVTMNASDNTIRFGPGRFVWRTSDGQAPRDSMLIIMVPETSNVWVYAALTLLSCLSIFSTAFGLFAFLRKRPDMHKNEIYSRWLNLPMLLGDLLLGVHVLLFPLEKSQTIAQHCMAAYFALIAGASLVLSSHVAKLIMAYRTIRNNAGLQQSFGTNLVAIHKSRTQNFQEVNTNMLSINRRVFAQSCIFVIAWFLYHCLSVTVWFGMQPLQSAVVETELVASKTDISLSHQFYHYECTVELRLQGSSFVTAVVLPLLGVTNGMLIILAIGIAQILRMVNILIMKDLKAICVSVDAVAVLAVAGCAICFIFLANWEYMQIALSLTALSAVVCNLICVFTTNL